MLVQKIAEKFAHNVSKLEGFGYQVEAVDNFSSIAERVRLTGRISQTPMMDIGRLDFTKDTAFWLFLRKEGCDVGAIGAKFVDLGDEDFEAYLRRTSQAQYGSQSDLISSVAPPLKSALKGKLVYIGELEFERKARGGLDVLEAFIGAMKALCALQWRDFDWMYAYIPEEHLKLERYYHFSMRIPRAITWKKPPPPGRLSNHYLIAEDRGSFRHSILSWGEVLQTQG